MDVVLVGLSGSGKSEIGRRLAARHGATLVDTDAEVERAAGRSIPEIFGAEGEASFRARDRAVIAALGPPDSKPTIGRVIATGGGTIVDPRSRWVLYRGRRPVWLDASGETLERHLGASAADRPLLAGGEVAARLEQLRAARLPFYAAAERVDADAEPDVVVARVEAALGAATTGTTLLRLGGSGGRAVLGEGIAATAIDAELRSLEARRAILVSEPRAWLAVGASIAAGLRDRGWPVVRIELPAGEDAKRLAVVETTADHLARVRLERDEPVVAIGGGALTDTAGFVAATFARGVPWIAVPTSLVGQIDAAIGGKTAVDLPGGKNLVGAFHRPIAIVIDVASLASLPERERRAALGEAVKTGLLGDERLMELLEADGPAIASGDPGAADGGAVAELVERCARYKLDVVARDPEERGERVALNLGHSLGHAIEAAAGFSEVHHGEAVAYGLRAACRIGLARRTLSPGRAERAERLLDALALGMSSLPYPPDTVLGLLDADKKRRDGRLRWVLPTDDGWTVDDEVPDELVAEVAQSVLAGRSTSTGTGAAAGAAR
ncbi:MAG TPA: bifunctional shikimate kinase/3-dehydroquinate synthase [Candidatus Limnocylindrales bacterium]|nr:bifunctional shikimate kinase/3-dehydroquinate synthase [Candidatus Limnocylindrales bacterium]